MKLRILYCAFLASFLFVLAYNASHSSFNNYEWLEKGHPVRVDQEFSDKNFDGGETLLVAIQLKDSLFSHQYLAELRAVTAVLRDRFPNASITTPLNSSFALKQSEYDISFISYDEALARPNFTIDDFRREFISSYQYGQLLSDDEMLFLIGLQEDLQGNALLRKESVEDVKSIISATNYFNEYDMAGDMELNYQLDKSSIESLLFLSPLVLLIVLILLFLFYRRWQEPIIIIGNCFIALFFSLNVNIALGFSITAISISLPIVMVVIATADSIFILNHWRLKANLEPVPRFYICLKHLWLPCFYVSITTAIGFGSFAFSEILPLHQYGVLSLVTITACSLIMVLNAAVGAYCLYPHPPIKDATTHGYRKNWFSKVNARYLIYVVLAIFVLSLIGLKNYSTETNFLQVFFSKESNVAQSFNVIDDRLVGTGQIQLIIKDDIDSFKSIDTFNRVVVVAEKLEKLTHVKYVNSYVKPVRIIHSAFSGRDALPASSEELAQDLLFLEFSRSENSEDILQKYLTFDYSSTRINIQTNNLNSKKTKQLVAQIHDIIQLEADNYVITGPSYYAQILSGYVVDTQYQSFLITGFINLLIFLLHFNLAYALIGFFATIFPTIVVVGLICWLRIPFDFSTVLIGSISEGLVVDMVIHYLFYKNINKLSVEETSRKLKEPITWTMIFLGTGFAVFILSDLVILQRFGVFNSIAIVVALFTALLILPSMLKLLHER